MEEDVHVPAAIRFNVQNNPIGGDNEGCKLFVGFKVGEKTAWMSGITVTDELTSFDFTFTPGLITRDDYECTECPEECDEYIGSCHRVDETSHIIDPKESGNFRFLLWDCPDTCEGVTVSDIAWLSYDVMDDKCETCS